MAMIVKKHSNQSQTLNAAVMRWRSYCRRIIKISGWRWWWWWWWQVGRPFCHTRVSCSSPEPQHLIMDFTVSRPASWNSLPPPLPYIIRTIPPFN